MRKQFSKSDNKAFVNEMPLAEKLISKKSKVVQEDNKLFIDNSLAFIQDKENQTKENNQGWFPSLHILLSGELILPKVIVDKGAIRFVVNGADIMRPGIVNVDAFQKNEFVMIVDETMNKPLAVGKSMYSSEELMSQKEGKVVLSLHYYGDEYFTN